MDNWNKQPAVKIGEVLKLNVEKFGESGDPILKHNGLIIFLKETDKKGFELGKLVEIKITKVCAKFAFAELNRKTSK